MRLKDYTEEQLIEKLKDFLPEEAYNEDAALIQVENTKNTTRMVINVDAATFDDDLLPGQSFWQLGYKTLMASASDLAAKGARFLASQASINISTQNEMKVLTDIVSGIKQASNELGGTYLGGDIGALSEGFVISVATIGMLNQGAKYLPRKGMKEGDLIWVSGEFGWTGYGFSCLLKGRKINSQVRSQVLHKLYQPRARMELGDELARIDGINACIDSSDGLARSLWILAQVNQAHIIIEDVPTPSELQTLLDEQELLKQALQGGEEFELIFCTRPNLEDEIRTLARKLNLSLTPIGHVKSVGKERDGKVESHLPIPITRKGWDSLHQFDS